MVLLSVLVLLVLLVSLELDDVLVCVVKDVLSVEDQVCVLEVVETEEDVVDFDDDVSVEVVLNVDDLVNDVEDVEDDEAVLELVVSVVVLTVGVVDEVSVLLLE